MAAIAPALGAVDTVTPAKWDAFGKAGSVDKAPFTSPIADFYRTDPISRASEVMKECSALFVEGREEGATGTHG